MQERWQNGVAEQVLGSGVSKACPKPFAISSCTLAILRGVIGLLNACPCSRANEESWMGEVFVGELELHLRAKRLGVRFVNHIGIGYKAENALLFFSFELLDSNLLLGITHSNCPLHSQNAEFDVGYSFLLPRFDCDGRGPVCKSVSSDGDLTGNSRRDIVECKGSILICYFCETIAGRPRS